MDTLNDTKLAALNFQNGDLSNQIDDAETLYLQNKTLSTSNSINDLWMLEFDLALIPDGQFNDRAMAYLQASGFTAEGYNERWLEYWTSLLP